MIDVAKPGWPYTAKRCGRAVAAARKEAYDLVRRSRLRMHVAGRAGEPRWRSRRPCDPAAVGAYRRLVVEAAARRPCSTGSPPPSFCAIRLVGYTVLESLGGSRRPGRRDVGDVVTVGIDHGLQDFGRSISVSIHDEGVVGDPCRFG